MPVSFAVALTLSLGTADAWAKANTSPPPTASSQAASTEAARTRAAVEQQVGFAVNDDLYEYAQREAKTLGLEDFEGGAAVIVLGGSALAVVLLVLVILLVL